MDRPAVLDLNDPAVEILGSVLANETGRRVLASLASGPKSPSDIARELGLPLTTVKHHVDRLVSAGIARLVETSPGRKGRKRIYALRSPALVIIPSSSEGAAIRAIRGWVLERASAVISLRRPVLAGLLAALAVGLGSGLLANQLLPTATSPPAAMAGVKGAAATPPPQTAPPTTAPQPRGPPGGEAEYGALGDQTERARRGVEFVVVAVAVISSAAAGAVVFWAAARSRPEVRRQRVTPTVDDSPVPPDEVGAGVAEDERDPLP